MSGLRISHLSVALLMSYIKSQGFSAALAISVLESFDMGSGYLRRKSFKGQAAVSRCHGKRWILHRSSPIGAVSATDLDSC
jgi:hypothetical protein